MLEGFQAADAVIVGVIIGLIEMFKQLGLPKRYAPVVAVVLGVVMGIVYAFPDNPKMGVLVGLTMGLTSVGLYSGTKTAVNKKE